MKIPRDISAADLIRAEDLWNEVKQRFGSTSVNAPRRRQAVVMNGLLRQGQSPVLQWVWRATELSPVPECRRPGCCQLYLLRQRRYVLQPGVAVARRLPRDDSTQPD